MRHIYLFFIIFFTLFATTACETVPVDESNIELAEPELAINPAIEQATQALKWVQKMGHEWLIRVEEVSDFPVPLSQILDLAVSYHEDGDELKATEYANIVSRFANLGIAQAKSQSSATPFYPQ